MTQYVYFFGGGKADGNRDMKDLLGGKGSGLAEMTNAGLPVPPGFTISTAACNLYYEQGGVLPAEIDEQSDQALARLEELMGKKLGDAADPLLVSVRSGAKFSMPGMMDTILNLGLNDQSVEGLKAKTGNGRFAKDCYRRFIQMYGNVVLGIDKDKFEHELSAVKKKAKAKADVDLDETALDEVIARYKAVVQKETAQPFPQDPQGAAHGRPRRRLQVLDEPPRHDLPQAERHPPRPRAPPSTCRPWSSATWATPRPPAWASPATPRPARRSSTASSCRTPRARTWWRASARRTRSPTSRRSCPRPTSSSARSPPAWSGTTRTSRTSSSPSRTTSSTCCRPATASARAWRRCTSRWTSWRRASSRRRRR